jgi:hypothetical protein
MIIYLQPGLQFKNLHYQHLKDSKGIGISIGIGLGVLGDGTKQIPIASVRVPQNLADPTGADNAVEIIGAGKLYKEVSKLLDEKINSKYAANQAFCLATQYFAEALVKHPEIWGEMMDQAFKAGEKSGSRKARQEFKDWLNGCQA